MVGRVHASQVRWDPCTGFGSIDGSKLLNGMPSPFTFYFLINKNSFGLDEAKANSSYPDAFWLVLEGFTPFTVRLQGGSPVLSGNFILLAAQGVTVTVGEPIDEIQNVNTPQRILYPCKIDFAQNAIGMVGQGGVFPAPGQMTIELPMTADINVDFFSFHAKTTFELLAGADPCFANVDPNQNNEFYLSQDLRVFTATPCQAGNSMPVPGGPVFATDDFDGAYTYIQSLLTYLNDNFNDPNGVDPFDPTNNVIPSQEGAYTGDSSVTPYSWFYDSSSDENESCRNYNFAIARVRLRGSQGVTGEAQNVKVFFRLWITQTFDTDYQPTTYPSQLDASGLPQSPLPASDNHTFPFFATSNTPDFSNPNNQEYGTNGVNNKTIIIESGDSVWTYFGCFLNFYDSSNVVNGSQVRTLLVGTHHCLVAQIACDSAPIINSNGVIESPENSDKLAQRNLQITLSDNPGTSATHRIPQTFDLRPSTPISTEAGNLLNYPDELMIQWGNTPIHSKASIYWPDVNAEDVLALAKQLYSTHQLYAADAHTIQCRVTKGTTYVPIPQGVDQNFAGLFTVDLPLGIVQGQEFNITVRRITTRQPPIVIEFQNENKSVVNVKRKPAKVMGNWRYIVGTFAVRIPVTHANIMLPPEENTLAIMKWRLEQMSPKNRWYPVLLRYISYIGARVDGLAGNSTSILPSPDGAQPSRHISKRQEYTGKVAGLIYDHFGDFVGFMLDDGKREHKFFSREKDVERLVERAWRERLRLTIWADCEKHRPCSIIIREPPAHFES
jgi:hypothetical protein